MRILHVEDDERDAELVRAALTGSGFDYEIRHVASGPDYVAALEDGGFSVILSDTGLPGFEGVKALDLAREKASGIPFLVVSGHLDSEEKIHALKLAGAADCVSKANLRDLPSAIQHALKQKRDAVAASTSTDRYVRGMERLVTVVQELALARDLDVIMAIVRRAARELTGADGATFVLRDGDLCHYADEDAIAPLWKGSRFPLSTCISGWAMLNRQPAVIEDIYADARIPHDAYRPTFVKSLAMVPIRTLDPVGAIGNYWAAPHRPGADEVKLLQALADTTAVAMENVRVYADLEQRVKDRTADLAAANKELEAFSFSVSHDLRAPLRHINGYAHMLVEDGAAALDDTGRAHLEKIQGATQRMGQLIDDLLMLSRTTCSPVEREPLDLSALAWEIAAALRAGAPQRNVEFVIADALRVHGDAGLLHIALDNLLANAWKYTSKKSAARIEVGQTTNRDGQPVYFVRDDGAGFDMDYAARLFGAFQRLHADSDFPGTGIGLATVQRIVRKHGGTIWADAAVDRGATFYFTLG